jgi:hypothetical protein
VESNSTEWNVWYRDKHCDRWRCDSFRCAVYSVTRHWNESRLCHEEVEEETEAEETEKEIEDRREEKIERRDESQTRETAY